MAVGPIETVRIFTRELARSRRFYADALGLKELAASDDWAQFDTGQARLLVEQVGASDDDGEDGIGCFAPFSFTVSDMNATLDELANASVQLLGPPERQDWGGVLAYIKDPDGNVLTLAQYPNRG